MKSSKDNSKKVQSTSDIIDNLSNTQMEVLTYLNTEYMTVGQIAEKRNTSLKAVYKIINKLKDLGILDKNYKCSSYNLIGSKGSKNIGGSYTDPLRKEIYRLHGQSMTIEILDKTQSYIKLLKKVSKKVILGNSVMLYENSLIIYSNTDFWGIDIDSCMSKASEYWNRFFTILENDLNVILIKPRKCLIKEFRCHIAKTDDALAKEIIANKDRFVIYAPDGKVRLLIDHSKGEFEFEGVDERTVIADMKREERWHTSLIEMKDEPFTPEQINTSFKSLLTLTSKNEEFKNELMLLFKAQLKLNEDLQTRLNELERRI